MASTKADLNDIDRAIHELRTGRPVTIDNITILHPDFADEKAITKLDNPFLLITANRGTIIFGKKFSKNLRVEITGLRHGALEALISGHACKFKPKFKEVANKTFDAALKLSVIGQLLPSAIITEKKLKTKINLNSKTIQNYNDKLAHELRLVADAPLKLCDARKARIKAFRSKNGQMEHMAIIVGDLNNEPLIRIHSSCYTGDLIGSLACDCGDQLRGSIKLMNEHGSGILIYLMQEGRGIGLINKLKAYSLQAGGMDTVEANEFLGFDDEERSFEPAAQILKELKIKQVQLITNNPKKVNELKRLGIKVTKRLPMLITHEHNHFYLQTKSKKSGHII